MKEKHKLIKVLLVKQESAVIQAIWDCPTCKIFPDGSDGKESACNAGDLGLIPGSGDTLEKEMMTHSSILARESHGQRSLVGYSSLGHKELDTTE